MRTHDARFPVFLKIRYITDFWRSIKRCWRSKALVFGFLLTAFEWYDYALFGYFAALIGRQFFPDTQPLSSLLASFAVFASGFAMRPLGAFIFGYIGDCIGRKKALLCSLLLMAIPTMALGLLPNYDTIGLASSVGLVMIRLCQGLAVGGNYGGSFIMTIEQAHPEHKGLSGSLAMFGTLGGLLMGSGIATILNTMMSPEYLEQFGWRIPFLLGGLSACIGYGLRHYVPEVSPHTPSTNQPFKVLWTHHLPQMMRTIGVILLDGVGVYILFVFMTSYAALFLHIPSSQVLLSNTIAMSLLVGVIPFFGWLGDKTSPIRILKYVSLSFFICSLPLFYILMLWPTFTVLLMIQILFAIIVGAAYGALPVTVAHAFPRSVRYTACGLAFNMSVAVFGGTAPFFVTTLIHITGWLIIPALVLSVVGLISFICTRKIVQII